MMKCNICGKEFELRKENRYEVIGCNIKDVVFDKNIKEAFDCPYCGCQNIVNERLKKFEPVELTEKDDSNV